MGKISISLNREQKKEILHLALVLFAITAITALALSFVNELTHDKITAQRQAAVDDAMKQVLPADSYTELQPSGVELDKTVTGIYSAKDAQGKELGYCVKVAPRGFGGAIEMVVGIDSKNSVTNVNITNMTETPGLGTKAKNKTFLSRFTGKTGTIKLISGAAQAENEVSAITGATVTSRGVTAGVQAALDAITQVKGGSQNG